MVKNNPSFTQKILLIILPLLLLEMGCRIFIKDEVLDSVLSVLEENHSYFWKNKNNLNQIFEGTNVITSAVGFRGNTSIEDFKRSKIRIVTMGASPDFGWGVEEKETYSVLLEKQLNVIGHIKASIINASQIGYSTHQGLRLLKEKIIELHPTHVLITYVVNDLDYYRFFQDSPLSDKDVVADAEWKISLRKSLSHLSLFRTFKKLAYYVLNKQVAGNKILRKHRVSLEDYRLNIESMIKICMTNEIVPILIKMPVNLNGSSIQIKTINDHSHLYNLELVKLAHQYHLELVDIALAFARSRETLFDNPIKDSIHPNRLGHQIISKEIVGVFTKTNRF